MNSLSFHRRNLPHYYLPNSTYFITFRVKDSIPLKNLLRIKLKYDKLRSTQKSKSDINDNYFYEYDSLLNDFNSCKYLDNRELSNIVKVELHKYDGKEYKLICYSILPNHVHLIFHLTENARSISKIMQAIKRVSAYKINVVLKRKGSFWQSESYDHLVRDDEELLDIINYTLLNPVKAGIIENWKDYKNNYLAENWE